MTTLAVTRPEEFIEFLEDDEPVNVVSAERPWKVLIVDDDPEVHQATLFALRGVTISNRKLELLNAYSSAQARAVLEAHPDVAVILLDVVMESHDAGLTLVRVIREELGRRDTRIILRTGQPGYAPELSVIRDYDINDYRTKSELTHTRLITTLAAAIRSYEQICALDESRRGLELLIETGNQLFVPLDVRAFAEVALKHLAGFFGGALNAVFCGPSEGGGEGRDHDELRILAGCGAYRHLEGVRLADLDNQTLRDSLRSCLAGQRHVFDSGAACLHLGRIHGKEALIHVDLPCPATELTRRMIEVLCVNLGVGFENVVLFERLGFFAYYDPLTRLPNRKRFLDRIDEEMPAFASGGWILGIIDIVRFSELNDALGHRSGDLLLVEVTQRLQLVVGADALVARVAGDAFGLCWRPGQAGAGAILDVFNAPFSVRGHAIPIRARAGFVDLAAVPGGAVELLKRANLALSHAKQAGNQHWRFFSGEMESATQNRVRLLTELRSALHQGKGLELYYQPQVASSDGALVGCEALIRWVKASGEAISPDVFIPLAEYTGMIVDIGDWVIGEACRQIVRWDAKGLPGFRVGINISAAQFREPDFVAKTAGVIRESGVDPSRLELEITESVAMEDPLSVARQLHELKALGLRVAVDDFGCGFSSLGSLNRLPFDRVKIDRAFVRELTPETQGDCIATMIIKLAKSLGLDVIAEGVETDQQARLLREMGCAEMQGFLYARPMQAEALEQWVMHGTQTPQ
ncbi:MAG: EAL domain-containing protein [Zoogloea sp.]|uniref:GGDEF/EAL domain-containing response regulator n=1 Tax=Zoogloea sp. TaxID=49181 RepID=UPI002632E9EE|nr:EAL domain-containing protein [Zoogloea sp.]MDD3329620.1 EAL domain-containing protein [Zoogloea sp.]